jgi:hypothetical protein
VSDAANVRVQPNIKAIQKKIDMTDAVAEVTENVTDGLDVFLKSDGLNPDEIEAALKMVDLELTK